MKKNNTATFNRFKAKAYARHVWQTGRKQAKDYVDDFLKQIMPASLDKGSEEEYNDTEGENLDSEE